MEVRDTGLLLNPNNIKLHRQYFSQMTKLLGINVIYRAPREGKSYSGYGELESFYYEPILVGCIFNEHPNQWTMKKLGWDSELQEGVSLITVPYDLDRLQVGALFIVPSGIDNTEGRVFRVLRMSTISVYPASIVCEIAPVWKNTFESAQFDHKLDNFSVLAEEVDEE